MNYHLKSSRNKKRIAEINVVPYIDVLLVLLIIFMVTIPLMNQSVNVELPKASTKLTDKITSIPVILTIDRDNNLTLNVHKDSGKCLTPNEVVQTVAAHLQHARNEGKHKSVMVRGDQGVNYQSVLNGIMLLKRAGVPSVGLMTSGEGKVS